MYEISFVGLIPKSNEIKIILLRFFIMMAPFVLYHICAFIVFRALAMIKARLKGAQKGHSLLKKKADALTLRFRSILKKIIEVCMYPFNHIFIFV